MPGRGRGGGRGGGFRHDSMPRSVLVSKALTRLLRHAAVEERIPIDNHGYVRMDHLLGWQRLRNMKPPVTMAEVVEAVQESDKKRFAMKYVGAGHGEGGIEGTEGGVVQVEEEETIEAETTQPEPETETETETQRAISTFESDQAAAAADTRRFFIRATQGHSMKTVEAENLLTPITLDDPATIPDTVVHGTFYGAWDRILASGGLKSMSRNHVHFASGPALAEVLPAAVADDVDDDDDDTTQWKRKPGTSSNNLGALLGKNKVISGMRSDAQILIYIDIRKALAEAPAMKWWRSENGVILSEGVASTTTSTTTTVAGAGAGGDGAEADTAEDTTAKETPKLVPISYFLAAVEVKQGIGLLWEAGRGQVHELPEQLRSRAVPRGKGEAGPRGRQRGRGREKG
ncbi:uncharacterized protein Z520_09066 [Fonsecaea multimorphosa CBS 102226]|uniref:2'-phosphotransferase n=1 Tax=Fonsecaea multimorphosa CBS 102226 TaxID=1442371 RepID=A0A0D2H001_9EURO|nr:uncharacterized protein Z520_09066 [Fonsecaea multimorphosa CBS 102226]KIX95150.1 hypothetical protein Z520_09066 [Fonsecaea multimorphosa CBS 102226]OAL20870.1 hypothetical protein AYO22_08498 [Fonsecaea multimorphosa]